MDILRKAQRLESRIADAFNKAAHRVSQSNEPQQPLEIVRAILDAIESQVEPAGRGRRLYPFNKIRITLVAKTRHERARWDAFVKGTPPIEQRIVDRLRAAGCDDADVAVAVGFAPGPASNWTHANFNLEFDRVEHKARGTKGRGDEVHERPVPRMELLIARGAAEQPSYSFQSARIDIGRRTDVRNSRNRLIRTNHIAFLDDQDAANQTVSRCHAHIAYDAVASLYRLHDDGSAHGTAISRGGKVIDVPRGSRGVRLVSGDEIALGEARLRVKIDTRSAEL